jgi:F-type H+-transporting ATPase subunit epsilon
MQVEIITPEKRIFAGEASAVQFPGLDGSFQVLNGHAPIISALSAGIVKVDLTETFHSTGHATKNMEVDNSEKIIRITIKGGVMEMQNNKIIVLAE